MMKDDHKNGHIHPGISGREGVGNSVTGPKVIFIFIDGVGMGRADEKNPLYHAGTQYLPFWGRDAELPDHTPIKPIDACLGIDGTPQSATGQSSLFTGENVPALLKEHKGSYPNKAMRGVIKEKNILRQLKDRNREAVFINAYPVYGHYFAAPHISISPEGEYHFSQEFPERFKRRISVSSCQMITAGQEPFNEHHIRREESIFQDYSNRWLIGMGLDVPEFSPEKAGDILYGASRRYDFLLYEYFQTDYYGHRKSLDDQVQLLSDLDRLVGRLLSRLDRETDTLLITSDHGNIEDSEHRGHTLNRVPLVAWGKYGDQLRQNINDLTDVTPAVLSLFP